MIKLEVFLKPSGASSCCPGDSQAEKANAKLKSLVSSLQQSAGDELSVVFHDYSSKESHSQSQAVFMGYLQAKGLKDVAAMGSLAMMHGTPALAINGRLEFIGFLPSEEEFFLVLDGIKKGAPQEDSDRQNAIRALPGAVSLKFGPGTPDCCK